MARTIRTLRCPAPGEAAEQAAQALLRQRGFIQVLRNGQRVWRRGIPYLIPLQYIQMSQSPDGLEVQLWTREQFFGDLERDLEHSAPPIRKKLIELLEQLQAALLQLTPQ